MGDCASDEIFNNLDFWTNINEELNLTADENIPDFQCKFLIGTLFVPKIASAQAELLQGGIFFLIHLFARAVLVMKKLEIEKTQPIFIVSVLKVEC